MSRLLYVFAGGGTGGHLYPGLAVAQALRARQPAANIVFACSNRAIDARILEPLDYPMVVQPVEPLPSRPGRVLGFMKSWIRSRRLARQLLADLQPAAVLGLGGFAAGPVLVAAARGGIPAALLNPDAVPGKANRYLAGKARAIFTQFESTAECFSPAARSTVRAVGCPIRPGLTEADPAAARAHFNLPTDRPVLLVFGGSLLANSISDALAALAQSLPGSANNWSVLHISSSPRAEEVERTLAAAGLAVRTLQYCDRMDLAYGAADLALARAGAGTVAELAATATPAVLLPYPYHKDQHQRLNAAELAAAGAAVICEDMKNPAATADALRETLLPAMSDPRVICSMRHAAAGLAKPNAADAVAQWLMETTE